jgi:hypothetical protein
MNGNIFLYDTTYMHSIQSGLINDSITILLLGERIIARKGLGANLLPPHYRECFALIVIIGSQ